MKHTTGAPQEQPGLTLSLSSVPLAMREARRWLLHDEKKIPYYASGRPRSGKLNSPRDLAQLVDFEAACAALLAFEGRFAGLGFALGEGWQGCDLDDVRDPKSGALLSWAADLIEKAGTYSEVSVSGRGVHLMGYGVALATLGANGSGIEFYADKRYFIVTGKPLNAVTRIVDLAPVYDIMTGRHLGKPVTQATKQKPVAPAVDSGPVHQVDPEWPGFRMELAKKLRYVPAGRGHTRWRNIGMGIHLVCGGGMEGFEIWHGWSHDHHNDEVGHDDKPVYKGLEFCLSQWRSFKVKPGSMVTWGTVQMYLDEWWDKAHPAVPPPHKLPTSFMVDDLLTMDIPATEWLVEGIIAPGLTLLTAPPKQGKSYLSLQMGMCVAAGVHFLGRATRACRVTYFDLEEWHGLLRERLLPIKTGNHIPHGIPLAIELETEVGAGAVEHMAREIAKGSKLLIVDLLARIRDEMSEDAKKNVYARDMKFVGMLAGFALGHPGVAIVVVHHANKGNHDDWQNKISGSAGMAGASHCNLYMARPNLKGMSEEDKQHAMRYRVLHANGKQVKEQELTLEMMDAGGGWQLSDLRPWEINVTRKQAKIVEVLRANYPEWVTSKAVADMLGMKPANVRQIMNRLAFDGVIESGGQGGEGFRAGRP